MGILVSIVMNLEITFGRDAIFTAFMRPSSGTTFAVVIIMSKKWKQSRYPSAGEWIIKMCYI